MGVLKVRDLMSSSPQTVFADEPMDVARVLMALGSVRHLPVVDREQRVVGLLSNRDVLRATEARLRPGGEFDLIQSSGVSVDTVMSRDVVSIAPEAPALEAATTMRKNAISCLPVVDAERLVGIVTESDFVEYAATILADPGQ